MCSKLDGILRRFLTKLNHKGALGRFRLRRALGNVLAIHKAAATAKSSAIFMLIYRYIFRVVSKNKPKKSKQIKKNIE